MVLNSIIFFLSLAASFFLFFFNVPYWTGQDMADMSKSGIWRAPFRFLSRIGFGFFKLYRTAVKKIFDACFSRFRGNKDGQKSVWLGIKGLMDVLCSAGVLFLIISGYSGLMDGLFPAGVSTLAEGNDGSFLGKLSNAVVFLRVTAVFKADGTSGTILAATAHTVIAAIQYVVINTLFYSILFGFLQELLEKRPFWELTVKKLNIRSEAGRKGDALPPQSLPGQLKEATVDFFNKTTIHTSMENSVSMGLFLIVLLAFSFVMTWWGKNDLGPLDVVWKVLEAIGVVQIVASFLVTYLAGKLGEKAAVAVVGILPQTMQDEIHKISARGNEWVKKEDERRHDWVKRVWTGLKKMNLFGPCQ